MVFTAVLCLHLHKAKSNTTFNMHASKTDVCLLSWLEFTQNIEKNPHALCSVFEINTLNPIESEDLYYFYLLNPCRSWIKTGLPGQVKCKQNKYLSSHAQQRLHTERNTRTHRQRGGKLLGNRFLFFCLEKRCAIQPAMKLEFYYTVGFYM